MNFLLADDHSIVRMGVRLLIESVYPDVCITEAENGSAVMDKAKHAKYDLITLDFQMPNTDIFGVISYLLARDVNAKILVYTMASEKLYAPRLFEAGVKGFLSKEAENSEVLKAIELLLDGGVYGNRQYINEQPDGQTAGAKTNPFASLSAKELDVLQFLIQGKNTKEISALSHLQMSTISTHKIRIFRKLNVTNMVELLSLAQAYQV
jgi:two-component system invasion response regulator UvrY